MSKDKSAKKSFYNRGKFGSKKKVISQGSNSTLQQINSAIGGQDKMFNGGSPVLFNAVKNPIIRAFKSKNVYQHVEVEPGTAVEDIEEDDFDLPEPTIENVVNATIAAQIAVRQATHATNLGHIAASGMAAATMQLKNTELMMQNETLLEAIELQRPKLMDSFNSQHANWVKEKEKYEQRQTKLMQVFTDVFGLTTLTTVKQFIDNNQFRRAWYEICTANAVTATGHQNTAILLDEMNNQTFDASTTSFASLESNLQLLEEQLVEHGEAPPTDEHRLYQLVKALKTSPGQEFENEINYVEMDGKTYAEARLLFGRKAATLASSQTLATVHSKPDGGRTIKLTHVTNNDKAKNSGKKAQHKNLKCNNCGKTNHNTKDCFYLDVECRKCGGMGHVAKNCTNGTNDNMDVDEGNGKMGNTKGGTSSSNFGSKFNNKNKAYFNVFDFTTQNGNAATHHQTDHLIGAKVACYLLLMVMPQHVKEPIQIILDSGASTHMLPIGQLCLNFRKSIGLVRLGDTDNTLSIMGIGDTYMDNVTEVLHVQGLLIGILSVSRFDKIQFRTEFVNGKGNVYDALGQLVLSSTLDSNGMYLLDPEYVEYLLFGSSSSKRRVQVHVSSVTVGETVNAYSHNVNPVKTSDWASNPFGVPGENTTNTNDAKVVQPWALVPTNSTSMNDLMGHHTIPVSDDENRQHCYEAVFALEGKTIPMTWDNIESGNAYSAKTNSDVCTTGMNALDILHRQLGHIGAARIKSMLKDGAVKGCKYSYRDVKDLELGICNDCLQGRMRAKPEGPTTDHPWRPLEKIAIDYKGDFARKAIGGYKGFMLLVDYATNWVHSDLVKNKSEHTRVLQDFKINYTLKYDKTWRVLQSDSESIFKSKRVANWLRKNEIRLTLSTPYQHWQNGQVEVYVRIVMDKTRTIMVVYNTPIKYWGYAVNYVCYTLNRTPNSNTNITPYEALTGTKPDISNAVPFYAPGVYHLTKDERKDPWSPKARPCRMLGYADQYKRAYIILNVETGRVIVRENCVFDMTNMTQDIEEIEVNQDADRDDIDEYDIMVEDSDYEESDDESDVSDGEVEDQGVLEVTDLDEVPIEEQEGEPAIDYGGDNPYWHTTYTTTMHTAYTLYDNWRHDILCASGIIPPLPPNPTSVDDALQGEHSELWRTAITKELDQFRIRSTFGAADQHGQGMKTKLILYYKYDGDYNLVCKARLVVCGYSQRKGIDYFETYSPTTTTSTVFILLCLAGILDGHLCVFDVSAAFLEGKADTKMFAWLPKSIDADGVSKRVEILGNWYGSKQAGKIWNELYDHIVVTMNFVRSMDNPCLYKWTRNNEYIYQTVHVDDGMMLCSSKKIAHEFIEEFMRHVRKVVLYDDVKLYLSLDIQRSEDRRMFRVSQQRYIEENFGDATRVYNTPMSSTTNLREAIPNPNNESLLPITGKLRFLADRTRPDILVALGEVSTGGASEPSDEHCKVADRIKSYLYNTTDRALILGGYKPVELFGYCDAAFISTGNSKSRLGSCLFLNEDCGAISSISRNDTTVSHSSTEAEIKAIDMICREIVVVRSLLEFLGQKQVNPTKVYVDNRSAIEICRTLKVRSAVKHINVRINYIRELINARVIELVFIPSKYNVADVLTKPLGRSNHDRHTLTLLEGHLQNDEDGILMSIETFEHYWNMVSNEEAAEELLTTL